MDRSKTMNPGGTSLMGLDRSFCLALLLLLSPLANLFADEFTYIDEDSNRVTLQARLLGAGQGFQALERTDGQIQLVPTAAILDRENTGDPEPIDCETMADRLKSLFTEELIRIEIQRPFIVALVLSAPLDRSAEGHAQAFLKKASRFMKNVNGVFEKYAESMDFPLKEFRYPIVLVMFESDDDFNSYTEDASGGRGLSASAITGFYSGLTNWLAVRMSACDSFEVPLHEAIHQQMYNRVLQRLAPIPKWFDEGIATGFEGNGERIETNPSKVNPHYARLAMQLPGGVRWSSIVGDDSAFTADVLAGNAYTLAWCLHWMVATHNKEKYQTFVKTLSLREPLSKIAADAEADIFASTFGADMNQLQKQFPRALLLAARKQRISLAQPPPGNATSQQALGQYSIDAVRQGNLGGRMQVSGALLNISPLRAMTFYVTVETESGQFADWLIPDLKPRQKQQLPRQYVVKPLRRLQPGPADRYRVFVRSVPAESREAESWKNGQLPPPVTEDE